MCVGERLTLAYSVSLMGHSTTAKYTVNHEDSVGERKPWSSNDQHILTPILASCVTDDWDAVVVPFRADKSLRPDLRTVASIEPTMFDSLSSRRVMKSLATESIIRTPKIELLPNPRRTSYNDLAGRLGLPFIVKGDGSVSGSECFLVSRPADLHEALARCGERLNTAWEYIPGPSLNFHFVCSEAGTAVLPPSAQVLTASSAERPFQFAGSDYTVDIADVVVVDGHRQVARVADVLRRQGYRGLGGLDLVVRSDGLTFGVDLNPRLQGSTLPLSLALSTTLGFGIGELQVASCEGTHNDLLLALAELPMKACDWGGQLLARNETSQAVGAPAIRDGVYSRTRDGWTWTRPYETPCALNSGELVVLDSAAAELVIRPGGLLCRVVFGHDGSENAAGFVADLTRALPGETGADDRPGRVERVPRPPSVDPDAG